jgi:hypothetical protein
MAYMTRSKTLAAAQAQTQTAHAAATVATAPTVTPAPKRKTSINKKKEEEDEKCLYCKEDLDEHMRCCPLNKIQTNENTVYDDITQFSDYHTDEITFIKKETKNLKKGDYMVVQSSQGCCWYIRNNNGCKQYLFMDADNWGQYGPETSHLPRYKAFIHTYNKYL